MFPGCSMAAGQSWVSSKQTTTESFNSYLKLRTSLIVKRPKLILTSQTSQRNEISQQPSPLLGSPHPVLRLSVVPLVQAHQTDVSSDPHFMRGYGEGS